eukprot:6215402-Prymnesium_polylepis.1
MVTHGLVVDPYHLTVFWALLLAAKADGNRVCRVCASREPLRNTYATPRGHPLPPPDQELHGSRRFMGPRPLKSIDL